MARKPIERSNKNFYHVMARSNNKEYFYLPQIEVWEIFTDQLKTLQEKYLIEISAFVLMNNHFHLQLLSPEQDIDKVMYFLMKNITLKIQKKSGRINKIFGGRYKGTIIKNYSQLANVYKYIYLNPVKAGIVNHAEHYPYSTLYYRNNSFIKLPFSMTAIIPQYAFDEIENLDEIKWINLQFAEEEYESIKIGLRKSEFSFAKDNSSGKEIIPLINPLEKKI